MTDLRERAKEHKKSKPLHQLCNIQSFPSEDGRFLTTSGHVGIFVKLSPPDGEMLEPAVSERITATVASALKCFGPDFIVNTLFLKASNPPLAVPKAEDVFLDGIIKSRLEFLESKGSGRFSFESYLLVLLKPSWDSSEAAERMGAWLKYSRRAFRRSLRVASRVEALDGDLQNGLKKLTDAVESFLQQVGSTIGGVTLGKKEAFLLLRRLWNPDRLKAEAIPLVSDLHLNFFAVDSELECHRDHLRLDDYFVKTLTLKRPPIHTFARILADLQKVHSNMLVSTEWSVRENTEAIADIRAKRRHWHSTKTSLWGHVGKDQPLPEDILTDPSKKALVDDLGALLSDIEMKGVQNGYFTLSVVLFAHTLEAARRATAEVMRVFGKYEAVLNEERYNGLNAFLAALPGGYAFNLRRMLVTNLNHADMGPWFLPSEGERRNHFLKRDYLIAVETEDGSIYYLNLHQGDVGHTVLIGPTGTGKSFSLNCLITHFQAYRPYTFIFGSGGDFRWITKHLGGSYLRCRPGQQEFRMNPFLLPPTEANLQFQFSFAKLLCEGADFRLTDGQNREVFEAVRYLPVLSRELRRISTLATTVSKAIGERLKPWTEGEQYGAWFDNPDDTFRAERVQAVDFEGMKTLGTLFERVLYYLLHRLNEVVYDDALLTTPKVLFIDEAWLLFRHPITRAYITEALKTWRKKNGTVVLSTQALEDLTEAEVVRPVVESCPTKLLLANPRLDPNLYADVLGLTPTEQEKLRKLASKRQFLLKRDGFSKVLNLNVDPKSYWLFTTNPFEAERREEVVSRLGLEAGLEFLKEESPR